MLDTGENYALFVAKLTNIALRVLRKKSEFWTNFCSLEPLCWRTQPPPYNMTPPRPGHLGTKKSVGSLSLESGLVVFPGTRLGETSVVKVHSYNRCHLLPPLGEDQEPIPCGPLCGAAAPPLWSLQGGADCGRSQEWLLPQRADTGQDGSHGVP